MCPTNAPKRCEWCKGPYHIRKRCPKLASLANENEKKRRAFNYSEQKGNADNHSGFQSNNIRDNRPNYHNGNGYPNSKSSPFNQRLHGFTANERPRGFRSLTSNFSEQERQNSPRLSEQNNGRKECFICKSTDHLKAQCPQGRKNNLPKHQKVSS